MGKCRAIRWSNSGKEAATTRGLDSNGGWQAVALSIGDGRHGSIVETAEEEAT